jgi:hypothetical protein
MELQENIFCGINCMFVFHPILFFLSSDEYMDEISILKILTKDPNHSIWNNFILFACDAPLEKGNAMERLNKMRQTLGDRPNLEYLEHWRIESMEEVMSWYEGGLETSKDRYMDGIYIRETNSEYTQGKSPFFLKVEVLFSIYCNVLYSLLFDHFQSIRKDRYPIVSISLTQRCMKLKK